MPREFGRGRRWFLDGGLKYIVSSGIKTRGNKFQHTWTIGVAIGCIAGMPTLALTETDSIGRRPTSWPEFSFLALTAQNDHW